MLDLSSVMKSKPPSIVERTSAMRIRQISSLRCIRGLGFFTSGFLISTLFWSFWRNRFPSYGLHNGVNNITQGILEDELYHLTHYESVGFLHDLPVWPVVAGKIVGKRTVSLASNFEIVNKLEDPYLQQNVEFYQEKIKSNPKLQTSCPDTVSFLILQPNEDFDKSSSIPTIENEKYTLYISTNGGILKSSSAFGFMRGLATFYQLLSQSDSPCLSIETKVPLLIQEQPSFEHRGFLIDTARNYYSLDSLLNLIRILGLAKMNVLHWHFVDDQSYGFESFVYPNLTSSAYANKSLFYTLDEVKTVIAEGRKWGVRIIPEVELPGHAAGWLNFPEMVAHCPKFACENAWSLTLNPLQNKTFEVLEKVLGELASIFPDPVMHLGGLSWEGTVTNK